MPEKVCHMCESDFPVSDSFKMGHLTSADKLSAEMGERITSIIGQPLPDTDAYVCGNCYFDLRDLMEESEDAD